MGILKNLIIIYDKTIYFDHLVMYIFLKSFCLNQKRLCQMEYVDIILIN